MRLFSIVSFLAFNCFFISGAIANDRVATVVSIQGEAEVLRGKQSLPVQIQSPLKKGDILQTKKDAILVLKSASGDVAVLIKPDSAISIETTAAGIFFIALKKGGVLSTIRPDAKASKKKKYFVRTRSAVMGVRGTTFFVQDLPKKPVFLCTCNGKVAVSEMESGGPEVVLIGTQHNIPKVFSNEMGPLQQRISAAPVMDFGHTDEDLKFLESFLNK